MRSHDGRTAALVIACGVTLLCACGQPDEQLGSGLAPGGTSVGTSGQTPGGVTGAATDRTAPHGSRSAPAGHRSTLPPRHVRHDQGPSVTDQIQAFPSVATVQLIDFGTVAVGTTLTQDVSLTNDVGHDTPFSSAAISGSSDFIVTRDACSGRTVRAGGRCTLVVAFSPTTPAEQLASLAITTDDASSSVSLLLQANEQPDSSPVISTVTGTGTGTTSSSPADTSSSPDTLSPRSPVLHNPTDGTPTAGAAGTGTAAGSSGGPNAGQG